MVSDKKIHRALELVQLYKQNLEKFLILAIYQNYTLALTNALAWDTNNKWSLHDMTCYYKIRVLTYSAFQQVEQSLVKIRSTQACLHMHV